VYQQQQQEQEEQQQDAKNPFLDPPFSRITIQQNTITTKRQLNKQYLHKNQVIKKAFQQNTT
jgi:16S rRNA G966 N2-methylase RsmD